MIDGGGVGEGDPGSQGSISHLPGKRVNLSNLCILWLLPHAACRLVASIQHLCDEKHEEETQDNILIITCFSSPELNWKDPDM